MNFTKLAAVAALAITAVPGVALAQEAGATAAATAGATVYGNDGMEIGTIESIEGETAILVVDGMRAPVPTAAFGSGEQGTTLNATKAQVVAMLQAAKQQADAARDAALVVGADVATVKGVPIGAVKSVEGDNIVVSHGEGAVGGGVNPDLRFSGLLGDRESWQEIVVGGALRDSGMPSFSSVFDEAGANAIRHYVIDKANWDLEQIRARREEEGEAES